MSFIARIRGAVFGALLLTGFFSFATVAEAAFNVSVSASSSAVAPNQTITVKFWSTQGTFPYDCTYSNSLGWSASRNITAGNRGDAPGNRASYMEEISFTPPLGTTTYSSQCIDGAGASKSSSTQVFVGSTPVVTLSAGQTSLPATGGSTGISWRVDLATRCTATDGDARWRGLSSLHTGGNLSWTLTSTTTFSLECFNANGDSSGKKSVTVYVGDAPSTCGNGTVERDNGEQCDEGTGNSNVCPATCSATCQSNGCDSVVDITMTARPNEFDLGDDVTISWEAEDAVRCEVEKGEGFSDPIGTSGSVTVYPTRRQSYGIECYDAGGKSEKGFVGVDMTSVDEVDVDLEIVSFSAAPSTVPFSSPATVPVTFSWNTRYDVSGNDTEPTCQLGGYLRLRPRDNPSFFPYCADAAGNLSVSIHGQCGSGSGATLLQWTSFDGSKIVQLTRPRQNDENPFRMELRCSYRQGRDTEKVGSSASVYFESDSSLAPQTEIFSAGGRLGATFPGDEERRKDVALNPGTSLPLYLRVLGADRCELTDSAGGKTLYPGVFVGERTHPIVSEPQDTTYTFECWRGTLSSRDSLTVSVLGTGGDPGDGDDEDGPTVDISCSDPLATCQAGAFCANGAEKVATCNGGLDSCCVGNRGGGGKGDDPDDLDENFSSASAYFNPLKFDSVEGVLTGVITQLRNIIVILSIIFIIIGAVMYILSAGNDSRMNTAKGAITAALIGLTLAIAAPAFLKEIASILGWTNITDASNTVEGAQTFTQIATKVLDFLLSIVGIIGIIMLVFGGFVYLTSAGDENKAETGKKIVTYAIIAIAIALSALVLVTQVAKFF